MLKVLHRIVYPLLWVGCLFLVILLFIFRISPISPEDEERL